MAEPCRAPLCDCMNSGSVSQARSRADAVFAGLVTSVRDTILRRESGEGFTQKAVTFRIQSGWKGVQSRSVTLLTGWGGGDCGYVFQTGRSYLVYATRRPMGTQSVLWTGICTRTAPTSAASDDLRLLGSPVYRNPEARTYSGHQQRVFARRVIDGAMVEEAVEQGWARLRFLSPPPVVP